MSAPTMSGLWRMVDGVPTIAWTVFDNFTSIAP
jgi:hypothetical protein